MELEDEAKATGAMRARLFRRKQVHNAAIHKQQKIYLLSMKTNKNKTFILHRFNRALFAKV